MKTALRLSIASPPFWSILFIAAFIAACGSAPQKVQRGQFDNVEQPDSTQDTVVEEIIQEEPDSLDAYFPQTLRDTYRVAYLLPFFAQDYPNVASSEKAVAEISTRFWWGAKLALDTMSHVGLNAEIFVHDTRGDTGRTRALTKRLTQQDPDLLIGPLFGKNVNALSSYCDSQKLNMVAPLTEPNACNSGHEYVLYSKADETYMMERQIAHLDSVVGPTRNIYLFYRNNATERARADTLISLFPKKYQKWIKREEVIGNVLGRDRHIKGFADSSVFFILSDIESFVNSVLAEIRRGQKESFIIGREKWLEYSSLDARSWERLNMVFFKQWHCDYQDPFTQRFVKLFRATYHEEPDYYAFMGYTQTLFYTSHMYYFGKYFQRYFGVIQYRLPCMSFNMTQNAECKAFENRHLTLYHFKDYKLVEYTSSQSAQPSPATGERD